MCLLWRVGIPATQPHLNGNDMGKGDKRTRKGKIFKSSYGKTRPHHPAAKKPAAKPAGNKR